MKRKPIIQKIKRPCVLRTTVVGTRVLIIYSSFREVLNLAAKPSDPLTITIADAVRLSRLSRATMDRMIAAGRAQDVAAY